MDHGWLGSLLAPGYYPLQTGALNVCQRLIRSLAISRGVMARGESPPQTCPSHYLIEMRERMKIERGSLRDYLRLHSPDIVAIVEPRISDVRADKVCRKFREFEVIRVEAEGFSGGVWVLWRPNRLKLTILQRHRQAIHVRVEEGSRSWLFTTVYGSPNAAIRENLWGFLHSVAPTGDDAWLLMGDFNVIASESYPMRWTACLPQLLRQRRFVGLSSMLWNDKLTEPFSSRRGIWQGYPLSPYLFVLCIERLAHLIFDSVEAGRWKPIRIGAQGLPISHIMFADDLLQFPI
ncbi:hypothetical protein CRG98_013203 [Punica granatum]|uniref:Endonuclease/exonuclease/phosphatase domain-containing protein n=1 Tax=Punica granatum TaxID=22663 RepID=A0A2I0KCZ8_PUNGR|nr:hypothetical protein CRG98_013203 [Punica granatum]